MNTEARIRIRVQLGDLPLFGPGKAALLTAIDEVGSIAGAARALGMSYRRAWLLVDSMNRNFTGPLVAASPGGRGVGGSRVTDLGRRVLAAYHAVEIDAARAAGKPLADLQAMVAPEPGPSVAGEPE